MFKKGKEVTCSFILEDVEHKKVDRMVNFKFDFTITDLFGKAIDPYFIDKQDLFDKLNSIQSELDDGLDYLMFLIEKKNYIITRMDNKYEEDKEQTKIHEYF